MSERIDTDRQQGDPIKIAIDLKHSLWSKDVEHFAEYAPDTLAHLRAGFDGAFDEYGDTIEIQTAPRKEIRFGNVIIEPKIGRVSVRFWSEFDDGSTETEEEEFSLPETLAEFMSQVDGIEERLIEKERR